MRRVYRYAKQLYEVMSDSSESLCHYPRNHSVKVQQIRRLYITVLRSLILQLLTSKVATEDKLTNRRRQYESYKKEVRYVQDVVQTLVLIMEKVSSTQEPTPSTNELEG